MKKKNEDNKLCVFGWSNFSSIKDLTRIASNFISHFCKIQEKEANLALCQSLLILILRKKEHSY
jgi:hypothetical protein